MFECKIFWYGYPVNVNIAFDVYFMLDAGMLITISPNVVEMVVIWLLSILLYRLGTDDALYNKNCLLDPLFKIQIYLIIF